MKTTSLGAEEGFRRGPSAEPEALAVLAIVVTHRGRRWIRESLAALSNQSYELMDILVVDDASPDNRAAPALKRIVKRHCRRRRWGYLRTARPLGFGGAINWALSRVRTDAELLLFVHDDAALEPGAVAAMVRRIAADPTTAILGPKVVGWNDSSRLEEVGMAVDRFGYPYKGLERGEIDVGQYDRPSEVFFVTSTCMLVRHEVFRTLGGWDERMRAFSEDLDLCWRARVAGHSVRVEPRAAARHAIALATGQRRSPFTPARYYIRRNRLRSIAKSASGLRLVWLVPQFVVLALAEMVAFVVLRQYGEIVNIARALGWNLLRLPQTWLARVKVQRARAIADRSLNRLTVKETTRVRAYVSHQAERLEEAWGRRAELLGRRTSQVRAVRTRVSQPASIVAGVLVLFLLVGWRNVLWTEPAHFGQLLPFPDDPGAVFGAYFALWRESGFGAPWPASPASLFLGLFPVALLGATGLVSKAMLVMLAGLAFVGAYRLMSELAGRPARWVAGSFYLLGGVGYAGIRAGDLGALLLGAVAPFALHALLRLTGWLRPPGHDPGAELARLALSAAIGASLVPGSLFLWLGAGLLLAAGRGCTTARWPLREVVGVCLSVALAWALLLPWSLAWLSTESSVAGSGEVVAYGGALDLALGRVPVVPLAMALAPVLLGGLAAALAAGSRRRLALALWLLVGGATLFGGAARGTVPLAPSAVQAAVLPWLCLALLAGLAVAAVVLDLPHRRLGPLQPVAFGALALAAALFAAGLGPALWRGEWSPGFGNRGPSSATIAQITAAVGGEARGGGARVLWVGQEWFGDDLDPFAPQAGYELTGQQGKQLPALFGGFDGPAHEALGGAIAAIEQGATDRGGRWLGGFDVGFVVLPDDDQERGAWLSQRDLAVARGGAGYLLLENRAQVIRAAVTIEPPAAAGNRNALNRGQAAMELRRGAGESWFAERISGPGTLFIAESGDVGWEASVGERSLARRPTAWGNAFRVPEGGTSPLELSFERPPGYLLWLVGLAFLWLATFGAATVRRTPEAAGGRHRAGRRR
jgi:GT2 family glycosyltransferase